MILKKDDEDLEEAQHITIDKTLVQDAIDTKLPNSHQ